MRRAQKRDAVNSEMFFFRKSLVPEDKEEEEEEGAGEGEELKSASSSSSSSSAGGGKTSVSHDHEYALMSIDTIVNGKVSKHWLEDIALCTIFSPSPPPVCLGRVPRAPPPR